ncbi:MAG: PKD domain-containing protein [Bacteroidia bacterium]
MLSNKAKSAIGIFALSLVFITFPKFINAQKGWSVHKPFEHDVFIENKGQFIDQVQKGVGQNILYYSHKGRLHLYFSATALTFEYDSAYMADKDAAPKAGDDAEANIKILPVFMQVNWDGANTNAQVEVQKPVTDYFTYRDPNDKTGHSSVLAHAWEKIIYHNLYNNIDVAFYYTADKTGLEYDVIVHPGGDISQVKMHYSANANLNLINREIHIISSCAVLTDKEPNAKDEDGNAVQASFSLNKNVVSFSTGNYDRNKTLTIDPTYTGGTSFTGTNKAYDLQYDLAGNVYVMGGGDATEYQLQKYNAAGTLQWTYTSTFTYQFHNYYYYGGFTTDNRSGSSYLAEGLDYGGTGCLVVKVNNAGAVVTTFPGSTNVDEIWRLAFDYCDNQLIIGAGEGSGAVFQGATLDTNCTTINAVNVLGAGGGSTHHDIAMITFDGVGKCYFATTKPASASYTGFANVLLQMPSATLAPTAYQVVDRSLFIETASVPYYPALPSNPYLYCGNGFNGLIADLNFVATYDGNKLRTWTPATGAIIDSVTVTPNTQLWGGIALDCQDNIYVGNLNKVSVYSSALASVGTLGLTSSAATDTIYDLHIAPGNTIFACGNDFVSATPVAIPKMVTTTSTNPTGCGCTGTASATVCDNYTYTYSWSNGATTSSLSGLCPGKYLLTVKDASCTPRQDTASVTITGNASITTSITATAVKCAGQTNGTATASISGGTAPYTYTWNTGATTSSITGLAAGNYTCVVKDAGGCIDTLKDSVIQPKPLTLTTTKFAATCSYLCNGQAIAVPTGGTNPYSYSWSNGGTGASVDSLCEGTTYSVTVTDGHGCIDSTTVTITNPPPIVATMDSTAALCGQTTGSAAIATVSGGTPGYTYLWNTGATTSTLPGVNADVYCVVITDANKCHDTVCVTVPTIPGDSAKIVATTNEKCFGGNTGSATATVWGGTPPYTYTWDITNPTQTTITATGLTAGTYTFSVTDSNGCIFKTYATITQPTPVVVTVPPDTVCIGTAAILTSTASGGTPPYKYNWNTGGTNDTISVSPTSTTSYNVVVTDSNGCTGTGKATVSVWPKLISVAGPSASICPGSSVNLIATATGGDGKYIYAWTPATGLNTTTGPDVAASPTVTTVYTVVVKDDCGTPPDTTTLTVTVYPPPVVNFVADTLQGCYPLCVNFTDSTTIGGGSDAGSTWSWTFGDDSSSILQNPTHCYTKPGVYTVKLTVTSSNGCKASKTINNYITVWGYPVAKFSYSPEQTTILNPTINFIDESTDSYGGIINWDWMFGDGSDTSGVVKDPPHTYADTGKYCITLIVTDVHECRDTTMQCLEIEPYFVIYVPNAFTPNNTSGLNNLFTAKGVGILTYQMWIFDRWGQQLYYTTDIYGGWNGVVQNGSSGKQAQEDTYVWLIEVTDVFHEQHRYIGRVTLIK